MSHLGNITTQKISIKKIAFFINVPFYKLADMLKFHFEAESDNLFIKLWVSVCAQYHNGRMSNFRRKASLHSRRVICRRWNVVKSSIKTNRLWSWVVLHICFKQFKKKLYSPKWSQLPLSHSRHVGKPSDLYLGESQVWLCILGEY